MFFGLIDGPGKLMPKIKIGIVEFEPQIRLNQLLFLQYICQHGNKTEQQLAIDLDFTSSAVARGADLLERRGLITVTTNSDIHPHRLHNATDQGRALVRAVANQLASSI